MKKLLLIIPGLFLMGLTSCKKENDINEPTGTSGTKKGESSLTVTGDLEGTYSGGATFHYMEPSQSMAAWSINMHDNSKNHTQTFSFDIQQIGLKENVSHPEVGTYTIGHFSTGDNPSDFTISFVNIVDGDVYNTKEYVGPDDNYGTLTITYSSEDRVEGHFNTNASQYNQYLEPTNLINISGDFKAYKLIE